MCLAVPMQVLEKDGDQGVVGTGNVKYRVSFSLLPDAVVDDYVIIHAGFAIQKLDKEEADERIKLFKELEEAL